MKNSAEQRGCYGPTGSMAQSPFDYFQACKALYWTPLAVDLLCIFIFSIYVKI